MELVRVLSSYAKHRESVGYSDDSTDRLHWRLSALLMLAFALVVSTKQYVGDPIECWCPAQFTSNYVKYTEMLCWVKNTYFIPLEDDIPKDEDLKPQLVYYQWTPFILLFQGVLFLFPYILWTGMTAHVGVSIRDITEAGQMFAFASKYENKEKLVKYMTKQIHYYLDHRKVDYEPTIVQRLKILCTKMSGKYLVACYLVIKFLYLFNVFAQFYLLNFMLGTDFESLGVQIVKGLFKGRQLPDNHQFPRITLCDFSVRGVGPHRIPHTVECVLSINLFNEKIFIFIWFWLILLGFFTFLNTILWLFRLLMPTWRRYSIRRHLKIMEAYHSKDKFLIEDFTQKYLRLDGIFILRMLANNSNDLVASEVTNALWENYKLVREHPESRRPSNILEFPENVPHFLSGRVDNTDGLLRAESDGEIDDK